MNDVSSLLDQMQALQKKIRALFVAFVLLVAAAVALMFLYQPAFYLLVAGAAAFYVFYLRRLIKRYGTMFVEARIRHGLCADMTDVRLPAEAAWDAQAARGWAMLPICPGEKSLLCHNSFSGLCGNFRVQGAEVTLHYARGASGARQDYLFLNGTVMTAVYGADTGRDWLLLVRDMLDADAQEAFRAENGYKILDLPNETLDSRFVLYGRGGAGAPDRKLLRAAEQFFRSAPTVGAIRFAPRMTAVYFYKRFYSQQAARPRVTVTEDMVISTPLAESAAALTLFRACDTTPEERNLT